MPTYKQKKQKLRELVKQEQEQRIRKIQQEGHQFVESDNFKRAQKHYKDYMYRQTDFSNVLKLQQLQFFQIENFRIYQLPNPQGAYLIKKFVDLQTQYQVGFEALNQFIFRPYRTNLDGTNGLYHENATNKKNETKSENENPLQGQEKIWKQKQQKKIDITKQNIKVLEGIDFQNSACPYYFNQKLRMANLGYQYDWPHRSYPATKVPIPSSVTLLTSKAKSIYQQIKKEQNIDYHGEAVIVNYYKARDYMTGHLDDGQQDQVNPIFSFCFGLSCIFLIGGQTRQKYPYAVQLDAGDLLIMSGECRVCYHGVPRIVQDSYELDLQHDNDLADRCDKIRRRLEGVIKQKIQNKELQLIQKRYHNGFDQILRYYKEHRLNINVRQVWARKEGKVVRRGRQ